jgi:hypothetical protein
VRHTLLRRTFGAYFINKSIPGLTRLSYDYCFREKWLRKSFVFNMHFC